MNGHAEGPVSRLTFADVHVPRDRIGLKLALRGINHARTHVAATAVGQATHLLREAADHAAYRKAVRAPIAEFCTVEAMLGTNFAEIEAGRALVLDVARKFDSGGLCNASRCRA
ncbi:acyl-CoA dehydrogenase family protein [Saccharopolyspora shandongensis]|uniref:acyl-CoA dehydrogenase family protein n=1 Tax=Saccharopolyspora shandongensis TaxID=418495 RepID=UPI00340D3769